MTTSSEGAGGRVEGVGARATLDARSTIFAVSLAAASLFHLAGNPRPGFAPGGAALAIVQSGVGMAALVVFLLPRWRPALVALCALIPISAWLESPMVGNHWVLAALLGVAYLVASLLTWRRGGGVRVRAFGAFLPSGRLVVLIAYAFAGFAKLNSDFFDPLRSCAVFYQDQLVGSWGLQGLSAAGSSTAGVAVAVVAAAIELSIPVLLAMRRTRRAGLLLAVSFHWLVGLDLDQHFWDFSSILFVGFLLFLDDEQVEALRGGFRSVQGQIRGSVRRANAATIVVLALVATGAAALEGGPALRGLAVTAGHLAWLGAGTTTLVAVWWATAHAAAAPQRLTVPLPLLWTVPLLVAFNGLTPYVELKTGFGWQMYSNLRTVDGETNHFLVPATLDLTGLQRDRVEILHSSDPALAALAGSQYEVVVSELREYARDHPDTSVRYRRDGVVHEVDRVGDDPALAGGASELSRRLQPFRVVDASGGERCLTTFSPAR